MFRRLVVCVFACLLMAGPADAAPRYKVVILNPPGWWGSIAAGISGGQQVGSAGGSATGGLHHAFLWSGTAESWVDLHPSGFTQSAASGISAGQQVGYGDAAGGNTHALLWSGTGASVVDLHPPSGFRDSLALGISAGQQVGYGWTFRTSIHALLWSGTPESCIDLHPNGFSLSAAHGISAGQQVGSGYPEGASKHALLWSGTPESCIDLHPSGYIGSEACGVSGDQQVGFGYLNYNIRHALLWSGTPESCIDLHPIGFEESEAQGVSGGQQVGAAGAPGPLWRALVWSGTPENYVDLHSFLPPIYIGSGAAAIDSSGNIVGSAWLTYEPPWVYNAVMWVKLPDVVAPVVSTSPATDVTKTSATLNGSITDDGGEACQYRFRYREAKGSYIYTTWTGSATSGQSFSEPISGLKANATYYFNAQAKNSAGESPWGNEESFVARSPEPPVVDLFSAFMISPYELYISMVVTFPKDTPSESNKKVDLWTNVNGVNISKTCDIPSLSSNKTAEIFYMVDFRDKRDKPEPVPRFTDNVNFTVYGKAYWEGGQYSEVASTEVRIPLPVIIIHGYTLTHRAVGEVIDSFKMWAYNQLINQLKNNGYMYASDFPDLYVTLWGPEDCEYQADKVTESDIYSIVNSWILRATGTSYADRVNIIGHCFGGLVARYYCGERYTSGLPSNVNKVIMIGTPHLGVTEFYIWAFEYSTKEDADRVLKKPGTNEKNLLLWGEPQYGVSCLLDVTTGTPEWVPEPYESTFNPDDNPNVQYYSIYANNHEDTPYKLYVKQEGLDWYSVVSYPIPMPGDGTVIDFSASAFADNPPPIRSGTHIFLCNQPNVIKRVLEILSDE